MFTETNIKLALAQW